MQAIWFRALYLVPLVLLPSAASAVQQSNPGADRVRDAVRSYRIAHEVEILGELRQLLSLPNVASDRANIMRNANHLVQLLRGRGASARLLEVEGSPPAVYGEMTTPGAARTVVFYAHYDGQPVDTTRWDSHPWQPVLRDAVLEEGGRELPWDTLSAGVDPEWRIYARSASDDKSPIVAMLRAIDALRAGGIPLSVNLKFFFEGEEEEGSGHLGILLDRYRDLLQADAWIFCDGPVHQTRLAQVVFGVRGVMELEVTTYGATRVLHSGHYGNWAPNPVVMLTHLLASTRDQEGRILIEGYYDDVRPVTDQDRQAIDATPDVETDLRRMLALGRVEGGGERLQERIMQPGINFEGIAAGAVGPAARNAIPTQATANLDLRLVPDQRLERVRALVEQHVRSQGFHIVHQEPDAETLRAHPKVVRLGWGAGYPAMRTSMELPISQAVTRIVADASEDSIVTVPILGGSLPLFSFEEALGVPLITVPMVNHDNGQHGPNENLRIQNLWEGIERYAALMARLGHVWR